MKYMKYFEGKKPKFPDIRTIELDGYQIKIGRDAKSNDYLTFIIADDEDIWLHVKGVPGSHVVIKIRENLPTPEILKYAASLAKKNSKAAREDSVKVVWCHRKFVKKEQGMNYGQVRVDYLNTEEIDI